MYLPNRRGRSDDRNDCLPHRSWHDCGNRSSFDLLSLLQKEGNQKSQEKKGAIGNQLLEEPLLYHEGVLAIQRLMFS